MKCCAPFRYFVPKELYQYIYTLLIAVQNAGVKGFSPGPVRILLVDIFAQTGSFAVKQFIQRPGCTEPLFRCQRHGVVPDDLADVLAIAYPIAIFHVVKSDPLDLLCHIFIYGNDFSIIIGIVQTHTRCTIRIDMRFI